MASASYSVTLHNLAPGAAAAGLGYPDEHMPAVSASQLADLLYALSGVAARLTIYEPSTPEIRIKTDREVYVIRIRYRRLCFVGRETLMRGEDHSVDYILHSITGITESAKPAQTRVLERPVSVSPILASGAGYGGGMPEWTKMALMMLVILGCLSGGLWMLFRPARGLAPKYTLMTSTESITLLSRVAGEYRTGTEEGDRRLIIGSDGTLRIAKYGSGQSIAEEVIRTAQGALKDGNPALATSDPYVMLIKDADNVVLYGQNYKRVIR